MDEYILTVKLTDLNKLEEANVDFLVDDILDLSDNRTKVEVSFDDKKEFEKAKNIINGG